jgi:hypothetical protein
MPHRHVTVPPLTTPPSLQLRPIQSVPQISFPQPAFQLLDNHPPGIKRPDTEAEKDTKELFRILDYPEGEIPVSMWC